MAPPDIPAAKRAGLPVDLARLTAEGDDWLAPEDRPSSTPPINRSAGSGSTGGAHR